MAKLKFALWIRDLRMGDSVPAAENMRRIHEAIEEVRGARDRRLGDRPPVSPPGSMEMPGSSAQCLAYAAALTSKVKIAPASSCCRPPPGGARQGISTLCHCPTKPLRVRRGPRWYARSRGHRLAHPGARAAHRRDHRGGDAPPHAAERQLRRPLLPVHRRHRSIPGRPDAGDLGVGRLACPDPGEHDVPVIARRS